jgi:DtxR family Mn-dependent transcriptional regulator
MTIESHPPLEEYLETIWYLLEDGIEVIPTRLSERMGRSLPTVTQRLDRLEVDGYLTRTHGRQITLTDQGRSLAEGVVRKHRLAECLLYDVIGLSYVKLHIEAGRWEHAISDEVETLMTKLLNTPTFCPHGNPIPDGGWRPDTIATSETRLSAANPGDELQLKRITEELEENEDFMSTLVNSNVLPGSEFSVSHKDVDSITIQHLGHGLTIDMNLARLLVVDMI